MNSPVSHISAPRKIALAIGLVLFLCLILFFLEKTHVTDIIHKPQTPAQKEAKKNTEAEQKAANDAKGAFLDKSQSTPETTSTAPNQATSLTLSTQRSGDTVTVLTKMQGISSGECTLKVQNGEKSTEQKAQVIYQPEFSSCAGFSIARDTLGSGTWQISVDVVTGAGQALSKTTNLEVE